MTTYALEKNAAGTVIALGAWGGDNTPIPEGFTECTAAEYAAAKSAFMDSLQIQATNALSAARTYVSNNYTMLNEATPDEWVTYLKALMAITNGTDTTSTALPTQPTT